MGVTWVIASPEAELKRIVEDKIYLERSSVTPRCVSLPNFKFRPGCAGQGVKWLRR